MMWFFAGVVATVVCIGLVVLAWADKYDTWL
jgi:hypothetical protein